MKVLILSLLLVACYGNFFLEYSPDQIIVQDVGDDSLEVIKGFMKGTID